MGEDDETASVPSTDRRDSPGKTCDHCGAEIDTSEWYPVTNRRNDDGSLQLHHFCTRDCQAAWLDERPA